jgi:DNA repair exonuclease SbcCD ATPase subunit
VKSDFGTSKPREQQQQQNDPQRADENVGGNVDRQGYPHRDVGNIPEVPKFPVKYRNQASNDQFAPTKQATAQQRNDPQRVDMKVGNNLDRQSYPHRNVGNILEVPKIPEKYRNQASNDQFAPVKPAAGTKDRVLKEKQDRETKATADRQARELAEKKAAKDRQRDLERAREAKAESDCQIAEKQRIEKLIAIARIAEQEKQRQLQAENQRLQAEREKRDRMSALVKAAKQREEAARVEEEKRVQIEKEKRERISAMARAAQQMEAEKARAETQRLQAEKEKRERMSAIAKAAKERADTAKAEEEKRLQAEKEKRDRISALAKAAQESEAEKARAETQRFQAEKEKREKNAAITRLLAQQEAECKLQAERRQKEEAEAERKRQRRDLLEKQEKRSQPLTAENLSLFVDDFIDPNATSDLGRRIGDMTRTVMEGVYTPELVRERNQRLATASESKPRLQYQQQQQPKAPEYVDDYFDPNAKSVMNRGIGDMTRTVMEGVYTQELERERDQRLAMASGQTLREQYHQQPRAPVYVDDFVDPNARSVMNRGIGDMTRTVMEGVYTEEQTRDRNERIARTIERARRPY